MLRLARRATTGGPSQQRWRDELVHLVRAHRTAEAETLDSGVVARGGPEAVTGAQRLHHVDDELEEAVAALAALPVTSAESTTACDELQRLLRLHADVIEQVLGPVERAVPRKEARRLGGLYEARRDSALRENGADEPPPRRLDLSRAELYELAKKAGVEGRSAMSRRDLISALRRRRQPS